MDSKKKARSTVSFKDIQIAYLIEGIGGVTELVQNKKNIGQSLRRAERELRAAGTKTDSLAQFIATIGTGTRGRSVPATGQERIYRAQKLQSGGVFLRLPLSPLGTGKSGKVKVRFERDRIVVENGG